MLTAVWLFLPRLRGSHWARPFRALLGFTFVLALLYIIYETLSLSFYAAEPVLYEQLPLVWNELPFLLRSLRPSAALLLGGTVVMLAAVGLIRTLLCQLAAPLPRQAVGYGSRLIMGLLLLIVLGAAARHGPALADQRSAVSCLGCKLVLNVRASTALAAEVRALADRPSPQAASATTLDLLTRPDIYLIFVESYGSILYQNESLGTPYFNLLDELQTELSTAGWHSATALSDSPTWGGWLWLAYASALFGLRLDSHSSYLAFRDRYDAEPYPNLGRALQDQGYRYAHVTPIAAELPVTEQAAAESFYGVDRWLTYADLGYRGTHYGWGPAPPDQFALGRAHDLLAAESDQPLLLFMLTQNSHYPWQEVPPLATDYRALSDPGATQVQTDLKVQRVDASPADYLNSIRYELRFLTQFVAQQVDDEALIILIGDHQPGYISRRVDGFATPVHVLSKDAALTAVFQEFGFAPGLVAPDLQPDLKHEGFPSLLLHALLSRYGDDRFPLPPYLPEGGGIFQPDLQ